MSGICERGFMLSFKKNRNFGNPVGIIGTPSFRKNWRLKIRNNWSTPRKVFPLYWLCLSKQYIAKNTMCSIQRKLQRDVHFFLRSIASKEEEHHWSSWLYLIVTLYVMSTEVEIQAALVRQTCKKEKRKKITRFFPSASLECATVVAPCDTRTRTYYWIATC